MKTQTCTGPCKEEKPATLEFFHKKKGGRNGLRLKCKECRKKDAKEEYKQNREEINKQCRVYARENPEKMRENGKRWRSENRARLRDYDRKRYNENIACRMAQNLRNRIGTVLKGARKSSPTMVLLGCTTEEYQKHLEDQFQEGMSWDNYGNPNGDHTKGWHVDHIRPCASFDLTQEDQQRVCFHYTNLQPLWAKDNLSKGDKWNEQKLAE